MGSERDSKRSANMRIALRLTLGTLLVAIATSSVVNADKKSSQKSNEAARARGLFVKKQADAMSILVLKREGDTLVPVDPSTAFKAGDQIKIQFQSNFEGYIYVVNIAPSGKRRVLVPYHESSDNSVQPDERYDIHPGDNTL